MSDSKAWHDPWNDAVQQLGKRAANLEFENDSLHGQLCLLSESCRRRDERIVELEADVAGLQAQVAALQAQVSAWDGTL